METTTTDIAEQIIRTILRQMHDVASEDDESGWEADRGGYLDEIALQYDYTDGAPTICRSTIEAYVRAIEDEDVITPADYAVCDYDTGSPLDGPPSADLIQESLGAEAGAVMAVWDGDEWTHIRDDEESQARARGEEPRCVYVQQ